MQIAGVTNTDTSLLRRGLLLEDATLGWNAVGAAIVVAAALDTRSVALAGFALVSWIEIFASIIVVWQLKGLDRDRDRPALRMIGAAFFALAGFVVAQAAYAVASDTHPSPSTTGMIWLEATAVAMLLLAWGKHTIGRQLGNPVLLAESRLTLIDAYLAVVVLVGLVLNAALGWWWADPLASLALAYYGAWVGLEAWQHAARLGVSDLGSQ